VNKGNDDDRDSRTGGPNEQATGTTGIGESEDSGVSRENAAENINPGGRGAAAPDPTRPDETA
jgi:hypothetical protein